MKHRRIFLALFLAAALGQPPALGQEAPAEGKNCLLAGLQSLLGPEGPPAEPLTLIRRSGRSQPGGYYRDAEGKGWYLKADVTHPELQTGAEVVSSEIYRFFGYLAPETHIVTIEGKRHSASALLEGGVGTSLRNDLEDTPAHRRMRVLAAYLKDWDRLTAGNNLRMPDGRIGLLDFGGSLGSRAQGEFKPGEPVSEAIGSFRPVSNPAEMPSADWDPSRSSNPALDETYLSYELGGLPVDHPWRKINKEDAAWLLERFRALTTKELTRIVEKARYSKASDRARMAEALLSRRDVLLDWLGKHFGMSESLGDATSYWASRTPIPELAYEVDPSCADPGAGVAIRGLLGGREPKPGHVFLLRGQAEETGRLVAPAYRQLDPATAARAMEKDRKDAEGFESGQRYVRATQRKQARSYVAISRMAGVPDPFADATWWDSASLLDSLIHMHTKGSGDPRLVSATRSVRVATRTTKIDRTSAIRYRYVYVLEVPLSQVVPVHGSIAWQANSTYTREIEYSVKSDATPYVIAVYDTDERRFLRR